MGASSQEATSSWEHCSRRAVQGAFYSSHCSRPHHPAFPFGPSFSSRYLLIFAESDSFLILFRVIAVGGGGDGSRSRENERSVPRGLRT